MGEDIPFIKIIFDAVGFLIALTVWLMMYYVIPIPKDGFACNDYSISLPYKKSTICDTQLVLTAAVIPIVIICGTELIRYYFKCYDKFIYRIKIFNNIIFDVPEIIGNLYINIGSCAIGQFIVNALSEYTKYSVGRLRPHYLDVCKPKFISIDIGNETRIDCKYKEYFQYNVDYICTNTNIKMLRDAHLSFPSGHASGLFYSMVFMILYVQYRWNYRHISFLKPLMQICLFFVAYYASLTRVVDNMHHSSDVVAGIVLGIATGIFIFTTTKNSIKKYRCCLLSNPKKTDYNEIVNTEKNTERVGMCSKGSSENSLCNSQ